MRPFVRYLLLTLGSLVIGFYLGRAWSQRSLGEGSKILSQYLALREFETLTSLQYKESDSDRARQSLFDLLAFMTKMETQNELSPSIQKGIQLDRGVTYVRLALLEQKEGHPDQSKDYMAKADNILRRTDMKDASEDHLRRVVADFDATSHYVLPYTFTFSMKLR